MSNDSRDPKQYCYLARRGLSCIKSTVAKKHLPYYECDKCIWRIKSENARHLRSLEKMFAKYGTMTWE